MSKTVVMKFGGTSVGSVERIAAVAERVVSHIKNTGERVVVVVSAMSGETDRLIGLSKQVAGELRNEREYSQLVSSGEQVSSSLTAMAIERLGMKARSLLAHQLELKTEKVFGQHLISSINTERLEALLKQDVVPVVAGFQGIDSKGDLTTLGRGGTDTTAVAIAAALGSCRCIILTDIDGVYSALPSICKNAKKLSHLTYEEMLEMANSGAKVLQTRSVSVAHKHKVPVVVCSSFSDVEGTEIVEEYQGMEDAVVSGVSCRTDEAKLTIRDVQDQPGIAAKIFRALADAEINVDMIVQSEGRGEVASISVTIPESDTARAEEALSALIKSEFPGAVMEIDSDIAKLSIVGEGMRTHSGVAAQMFEILGREGINVQMITTSEIKVSVAIEQKYSELAVRVLHEAFIER